MAAVLRDLGLLREIVRTLSIVRGSSHKPDFNGQRQPNRDRCLACLPKLALAASARLEVLLPSSLLFRGVFNSLEYLGLLPRGHSPREQRSAGFTKFLRSRLAISHGSLALWSIRRRVLCGTDATSIA